MSSLYDMDKYVSKENRHSRSSGTDMRFVQGSPEWLAYRKTKLGATDFVVLMGKSPYKTVYQLYKEKIGEDVGDVSKAILFEKAHEIEQDSKDYIEEYMRKRYPETFIALSSDPVDCEALAEGYIETSKDGFYLNPYTRASLDYALKIRNNWVKRRYSRVPVEVKYNSIEKHSNLLNGKIDEGHLIQMHIQMHCTGCDWAFYVSFNPNMVEEGTLLIKKVDIDFSLLDECLAKGRDFLQNHLLPKIPPEPDVADATKTFLDLEIAYRRADDKKRAAEAKLRCIKSAMEIEAAGRAMQGSLYKIRNSYRQGALDSKALADAYNIDIDYYRKKGAWFYTVSRLSASTLGA